MNAEDYVRRVGFALRDLPWRTRRDLVSDLREHLAELPGDTDLTERLGTPEQYTADLRVAARLERRRGLAAFVRARRPRNLALVFLGATVIGLAIGAVAWIDSYQPLVFGASTMDPEGVVNTPAGGAYVVVHTGRPFRYGFTVRNDGRFTVRVLGMPKLYGFPFTARLMMSGPTRNGGMPLPSKRFRPVDLKPGYTLALYLVGRYACNVGMSPGSSTTLGGSFGVRYGFLWRTATATIHLPDEVVLLFPEGVGCPQTRTPGPSTP